MLQNALNEYIQNPNDASLNWNLGQIYEYQGHLAAALSYYIRAAERSDDKKVQYECLIRAGQCYWDQNIRNFTARGLLQRAIALLPKRPEAYWLYSKLLFENKQWEGREFDSYTIASMALEVCDFDLPQTDPLITNVNYPGKFSLLWQKANASWYCGLCDEARRLFKDLLDNWDLDEYWTNETRKALGNITYNEPFAVYKSEKHGMLRYKFSGSELIEQNFSEAYQDMFVLSLLDGKRYGTYLEIGAGNSFYGNNTALLEQQFDWTGVAIDIDEGFVNAHNKERKNPCYLKDATSTNYSALLMANGINGVVDYLQVDCDPPEVSFKALLNIPFETTKFRVITFEHDVYQEQTNMIREKARMYLESYGYILVADNISPDDNRPYEDWFVYPDLIDPVILKKMMCVTGKAKMAERYILGEV